MREIFLKFFFSNFVMCFSEVKHFWAEYLESVDDLEGAMHQYEGCGDIHSQVRILQLLGDIQRAVEVVEKTRDKSAAYYLAQHLSHSDQVVYFLFFLWFL